MFHRMDIVTKMADASILNGKLMELHQSDKFCKDQEKDTGGQAVMDEDNFLELLEIYMDMVEKQEEIIYRLGKVTKRLVEDLKLLRNDQQYSEELTGKADGKLDQDMAIIEEVMDQYEKTKAELEP